MCDIREFQRRLDQGHEEKLAYLDNVSEKMKDKDFARKLAIGSGIWTETGEIHPNYSTEEGTNYSRGPKARV